MLRIHEIPQEQLINKDIPPPIDPILKPFCDVTGKLLHELIVDSFDLSSPHVHVDFSKPPCL